MHHKFDPTKAIEASAVIARREGKRVSRLRMLKLMYIADRESIKKRGRPILGSKFVAMNHGPLHSDVYDMVKGEHPAAPRLSKFFTVERRDLRLTKEPANLALSRADIAILQEVVDKYIDLDDWTLSELTHKFPEWSDVYEADTSHEIPIDAIVAAVRPTDASSVMQDIRDDDAFDRFFEKHTQ